MARPLIVTRDTQRLLVRLPDDWVVSDPATVTLTVMRKGKPPCPPVQSYPPDPCGKLELLERDTACVRWDEGTDYRGAHCRECLPLRCHSICRGASPALACRPVKTYFADSVACGVVIFLIDHDLSEAPEGWYSCRLAMMGRACALTIWVQ